MHLLTCICDVYITHLGGGCLRLAVGYDAQASIHDSGFHEQDRLFTSYLRLYDCLGGMRMVFTSL